MINYAKIVLNYKSFWTKPWNKARLTGARDLLQRYLSEKELPRVFQKEQKVARRQCNQLLDRVQKKLINL